MFNNKVVVLENDGTPPKDLFKVHDPRIGGEDEELVLAKIGIYRKDAVTLESLSKSTVDGDGDDLELTKKEQRQKKRSQRKLDDFFPSNAILHFNGVQCALYPQDESQRPQIRPQQLNRPGIQPGMILDSGRF